MADKMTKKVYGLLKAKRATKNNQNDMRTL